MIPKKLRDFMSRVFAATNDGELSWQEGAEEAYFAAQKDANLHVRYAFDADTGDSAYFFRIVRGGKDAFFSVTNEEDDFQFMRNLFSAISVSVAGGDFTDDLFD